MSGLSINSSSSISTPMRLSSRKADAKLQRRISGSEEGAIELKASSVYSRKQDPSPYTCQPQLRPWKHKPHLPACPSSPLYGRRLCNVSHYQCIKPFEGPLVNTISRSYENIDYYHRYPLQDISFPYIFLYQ